MRCNTLGYQYVSCGPLNSNNAHGLGCQLYTQILEGEGLAPSKSGVGNVKRPFVLGRYPWTIMTYQKVKFCVIMIQFLSGIYL
jgi:hypothetical protein